MTQKECRQIFSEILSNSVFKKWDLVKLSTVATILESHTKSVKKPTIEKHRVGICGQIYEENCEEQK